MKTILVVWYMIWYDIWWWFYFPEQSDIVCPYYSLLFLNYSFKWFILPLKCYFKLLYMPTLIFKDMLLVQYKALYDPEEQHKLVYSFIYLKNNSYM